MWTLVRLGVAAAYLFNLRDVSTGLFPEQYRMGQGVGTYFEAAVVIIRRFVGQVLELRARERTGDAIRALLDLAPKQRGVFCRRHGNTTHHWKTSWKSAARAPGDGFLSMAR
jgi:cation transport ATPase